MAARPPRGDRRGRPAHRHLRHQHRRADRVHPGPLRGGGGDRRGRGPAGADRGPARPPAGAAPPGGDGRPGRGPDLRPARAARRRRARGRPGGAPRCAAARRPLLPDLHLGHHGPAQGGDDRPPQRHVPGRGRGAAAGAGARRPDALLPAALPHRRADGLHLPADGGRLLRQLRAEPGEAARRPARGAAHPLLRGAAGLGEDPGPDAGGGRTGALAAPEAGGLGPPPGPGRRPRGAARGASPRAPRPGRPAGVPHRAGPARPGRSPPLPDLGGGRASRSRAPRCVSPRTARC